MNKINSVLIFIFIWPIVASVASCESKDQSTPISFEAMRTRQDVLPDKPQFIKASDGGCHDCSMLSPMLPDHFVFVKGLIGFPRHICIQLRGDLPRRVHA